MRRGWGTDCAVLCHGRILALRGVVEPKVDCQTEDEEAEQDGQAEGASLIAGARRDAPDERVDHQERDADAAHPA